jgi:pyruvate formate lyase activating enzyme
MNVKNSISQIDRLPESACDYLDKSGLDFTRREFLKSGVMSTGAVFLPSRLSSNSGDVSLFPEKYQRYIIEARYYEKLAHRKIRCKLCPRECVIDDRERGYCGVRENRNGSYYTLVYSRPCALHADPIEKKPLFHFYPGSQAFSIATAGCNVNCKFCQNWQISQVRPEEVRDIYLTPEKTAIAAKRSRCLSIAFTYSEPTIFYEYMFDTVLAAQKRGIKNVVVTAGYISQEPLIELCQHVDAIKVDLKSFRESYYRDIVNGELKPVLDSLVTMKRQNVWTEIVYLVVPTLNDSEKELKELCRWIYDNLGADVPVHFTRFHPQYLLKNLPPTPLKTLELAAAIARAQGLHYIYIGNVPGHPSENTSCPSCGKHIIERRGYIITKQKIINSTCAYCNTPIAGVWE